ncbi:ParB N-terminal domain-containing protein [Bradyrhizobium sp. RT9a]|uniref:ParB N-terminal domain-containing protein n=1 Tax=Bradyrhizobium sp. RT9a TaxID=3156384 RepID=UPI003399316B
MPNNSSDTKQPTSWRDVITVHPAADLFPMMSADELKTLGEDIKANGLRVPVVVWKPQKDSPAQLLDGRNRLDAIEAAGITIHVEEDKQHLILWRCDAEDKWWRISTQANGGAEDGFDPYAYVISANVHRRHLTPEQKRDLIAAVLKAQPEKSNRQVAKAVGVSHPHVAAVRAKLEKSGDVEAVTTSIDTKGRRQQAHKPERTSTKAKADRAAVKQPKPLPDVTEAADRAEAQIGMKADDARFVQLREVSLEFAWLIENQAERLSGDDRTFFLVVLLTRVERLLGTNATGGEDVGAEPVGDDLAPAAAKAPAGPPVGDGINKSIDAVDATMQAGGDQH